MTMNGIRAYALNGNEWQFYSKKSDTQHTWHTSPPQKVVNG